MDTNSNKKQNRAVTIFACFLSVVSIGLLVFGFFIVSSDKVVMLQSISNLSNKLESLIINDNDDKSNLISDKSNIRLKSDIKISSGEDKISLLVDYIENLDDKKSSGDIKVYANDNKLVDGEIALADNNFYIFLDQITSKFYYTEMPYISLFSKINPGDIETMVSYLKEVVIDYIDEDDIKKQKVSIDYEGKSKKVNKLVYEVNRKTVKDIVDKFIEKISKNKDIVRRIALTTGSSIDEVKTNLKKISDHFKYEKNDKLFDYVVYYYGFNKIAQYDIVIDDMVFSYKEDRLTLNKGNEKIISILFNSDKDTKTIVGNVIEEGISYQFSIKLINNKVNIEFDCDKNISYLIDIEYDKKMERNIFTDIYKINISSRKNDIISDLFDIDITNKLSFDDIVNIDLDDATNFNDITEEELIEIMEKIENISVIKNISELLTV